MNISNETKWCGRNWDILFQPLHTFAFDHDMTLVCTWKQPKTVALHSPQTNKSWHVCTPGNTKPFLATEKLKMFPCKATANVWKNSKKFFFYSTRYLNVADLTGVGCTLQIYICSSVLHINFTQLSFLLVFFVQKEKSLLNFIAKFS